MCELQMAPLCLAMSELAFVKLQEEQSPCGSVDTEVFWKCWCRSCIKQVHGPYTALHLAPFTLRGTRRTQLWCLSLPLQELLLAFYRLRCACLCIAILANFVQRRLRCTLC